MEFRSLFIRKSDIPDEPPCLDKCTVLAMRHEASEGEFNSVFALNTYKWQSHLIWGFNWGWLDLGTSWGFVFEKIDKPYDEPVYYPKDWAQVVTNEGYMPQERQA